MEKSNVYADEGKIKCHVCGKDLMDNVDGSLVNIIQNTETGKVVSVRCCCKGTCDRIVSSTAKANEISGWKDLREFTNPYLYFKHIVSVMNNMQEREFFENQEAYDNYKDLILKMYPYVSRNMSENEKEAALIDNMYEF